MTEPQTTPFPTGQGRLWEIALAALYTLSGMTSLAFEVLWARMLSLQFGISIFGVVITVAAFMAGLGLGSLVGLRIQAHVARPLRWFAVLEAAVAGYALLLPWGFQGLDAFLAAAAFGVSLDLWYVLQGAALMCFMLLPATAMGIGFPLLLRAIRGSSLTLGRLYGVNAAGAALGALLPLYLLPAFGWIHAVQLVAAIGFLVSAGAAWLSTTSAALPAAAPAADTAPPVPRLSLIGYGIVGAAAIVLEIGWTRLFGMILLRTEYVLAIILAVYLLGIGLGSLIAHHLRHPRWLSLFPLVAALTAVASLWALPALSRWVEAASFSGLAAALCWQGLAVVLLTLPVTLILGAWLPLLSDRLGGAAGHGALLYGVNSLGAAAGGLLAGFVMIPWLGTTATIIAAALFLFMAGMIWAQRRAYWATVLLPLLLAWPVKDFPPISRLLPQAHGGSQDLYLYEDAMSITHVVEGSDGQRVLLSDLQRMDAASDPTSVALQKNQARLALLLKPDASSALFLGLGTGISASGALSLPALKISAVELSRGSIDAAGRWFGPVNGGVMAHIAVAQDDARRFLRTTPRHYDLIIGDVFHPDLVGRSALLSVQQFRRARARLSADGLFLQWLALNQFDQDALETVLRSFYAVFPKGALFMDGFRLALVGPRDEFPAVSDIVARYQALPATVQEEISGGEGIWTWLGRYWGAPRPAPGPVQDEWRPHIEYSLPHVRFQGGGQLKGLLTWLVAQRPPLQEAAQRLNIGTEQFAAFERGFVGTDLAARSWLARLNGRSDETYRLIRFAYQANPRDRWTGFALADAMMASLAQARRQGMNERQALTAVLKIRPDHVEALRRAWQLARQDGDSQAAAAYLARLHTLSPLDREVRGQRTED
ncbi:MAG: spermine synthase [Gammaproteobacteria bacterium]